MDIFFNRLYARLSSMEDIDADDGGRAVAKLGKEDCEDNPLRAAESIDGAEDEAADGLVLEGVSEGAC
jgi:hypothetical protein